MPKINIYVPDDLAAAVRAAGFPVSPICQQALAEAVRATNAARKAIGAIQDPSFDPDRYPQIGLRLGRRMTPRLREAINLARRASGDGTRVDSRHLLIGILDERDNLGVRLLQALAVDVDELRQSAVQLDTEEPLPTIAPSTALAAAPGVAGAGEPAVEVGEPGAPDGEEPSLDAFSWAGLTVPARSAMAASLAASIELGHNYLGCEHLLLGLLADEHSGAARLLRELWVEHAAARRAVTTALAGFVHARQTSVAASTSATSAELDAVLRRLDALESRLAASGS